MTTVSGPVSGSAQLGAIYLLHCGVGVMLGGISASGAIQPMDPLAQKEGCGFAGCVSHPIPSRERLSPRRVPEWLPRLSW